MLCCDLALVALPRFEVKLRLKSIFRFNCSLKMNSHYIFQSIRIGLSPRCSEEKGACLLFKDPEDLEENRRKNNNSMRQRCDKCMRQPAFSSHAPLEKGSYFEKPRDP